MIMERIIMTKIDWEQRSKERRLENKQLKKRIKELTKSRDDWKKKAIDRKTNIGDLNKKIEIVKKNLQQIIGI